MYGLIKDYLVSLSAPTSLIGILALLALVLRWRGLRPWALRSALCSAGLFMVFSLNPVTEAGLYLLENQYPGFEPNALTPNERSQLLFIVVLGGGFTEVTERPLSAQLAPFTMPRLVEGVRLWHALPHSRLILSGRGWEQTSEAQAMKTMAMALGVPAEKIAMDELSRSTAEHPRVLRNILKDKPFVLVTSALHMPRAMALFQAHALLPTPAPCAHLLTSRYHFWHNKPPYPRGDNLAAADLVYYELMGLVWSKLKGEI